MAKQAVLREVKGLTVACDAVGNTLLVKFSFHNGGSACALFPAHVVFWLLERMPRSQDPNLPAPLEYPPIDQMEWDDHVTPRVMTLNCNQFADALRMELMLDHKPALRVLLNPTNVEVLRQFFEKYRGDLMELDLF